MKVLRELASLKRLARAPDDVLPLPKDQMVAVLQRSPGPEKEKLIEVLDMFVPGQAPAFLARLISRPTILSIAYTVAIAVQGASWFWGLRAAPAAAVALDARRVVVPPRLGRRRRA